MKTIAKTLIAALMLSTSTFASHMPHLPKLGVSAGPTAITDSYKVAIYPSGSATSKLNVIVERQPGQTMEVLLKDSEGSLLATKYIGKKEGNVHIKFDLAELIDGTYSIEVVSGTDKTVHVMTLLTKAIQPARTVSLK
ncbi:hypothetical protein GCM10028805_04700 [Spirosoma harenae]